MVGATAVVAVVLLLLSYTRLERGYAGAYDCYRSVNNEALTAAIYVDNPNNYTSNRFRVTYYYSNGTTVVRGASMPRVQSYTYYLTSDNTGGLVLVKVEG
ncbi:hypothetical protein [Thermofilum sp.]|uniref:hypothetical protein n=1 Tax=Thermofilum sp. TaxID=1961369 RepID=UPI0031685F4F